MDSNEIRSRFLKFFEKRGHKIIPSASLAPENDLSVLFNTAGMQPLVPYLMGQKHPAGNRLVNIQKCVRTQDIDEVGDKTHDTFFEMMGNWSLGDYFKIEAINWSYEFLTSKEEGLGLDPRRLYVTVFEGNENAPRDEESANIWQKIFEKAGIMGERIYFRPEDKNWWSVGDNGPCGPDTEMFYDLTGELTEGMTLEEYLKADDEQRIVEIWNNVFMEYEKKDGKVIGKLKQRNVDTGSGLERVVMAVQGKDNIFETDLFSPIMDLIKENADTYDLRSSRIIADHIRTASMLIWDKVAPFHSGRGYVLRRLIRRALFWGQKIGFSFQHRIYSEIISIFFQKYNNIYNIKQTFLDMAQKIFDDEAESFSKAIVLAKKYIEKNEEIDVFFLFSSYGLPPDLTIEIADKMGKKVDLNDFNEQMKKHQNLSRSASAGMFKGGLANHNEKTIKLHTAHHLLLAGLQAIIGPSVKQRGSNITEERLRIDFLCNHKLTEEEKKKVEDWVNDKIKLGLDVTRREIPLHLAEKIGAEMEFGAKYPDVVSVYFIGSREKQYDALSKELCGGPHVSNTGVLGTFKIQKEEAVAQGVRRIKAVLL